MEGKGKRRGKGVRKRKKEEFFYKIIIPKSVDAIDFIKIIKAFFIKILTTEIEVGCIEILKKKKKKKKKKK